MKNFFDNPAYQIGMLLACTVGIVVAIVNIRDNTHVPYQILAISILFIFIVLSLLKLNSFFKNLQPKPVVKKEPVYTWDGKIASSWEM